MFLCWFSVSFFRCWNECTNAVLRKSTFRFLICKSPACGADSLFCCLPSSIRFSVFWCPCGHSKSTFRLLGLRVRVVPWWRLLCLRGLIVMCVLSFLRGFPTLLALTFFLLFWFLVFEHVLLNKSPLHDLICTCHICALVSLSLMWNQSTGCLECAIHWC